MGFALNTDKKHIHCSSVIGLLKRGNNKHRYLSRHSYTTKTEYDHEIYSQMKGKINAELSLVKTQLIKANKSLLAYYRQNNFSQPQLLHRDVKFAQRLSPDERSHVSKCGFGTILYTDDPLAVGDWTRTFKIYCEALRTTPFKPNFNPNTLMSIRRNRVIWDKTKSLKTTFTQPIACYKKYVEAFSRSDHPHLIELMSCIIEGVKQLTKTISDLPMLTHCCDDIIRTFLSKIDDLTFYHSYDSKWLSQLLTPLHGLSTFGGPRGWHMDDIKEGIKEWVSGVQEFGTDEARSFRTEYYSKKTSEWSKGLSEKKLSFEEYITDPMRWATSGGAPPIEISGVKIRSKWAWVLDKLQTGENIYSLAKTLGDEAHVALKEEKKTRLVITTPMASYLRQCYMLYRFGKMPINSTISDSHLIDNLARTGSTFYMSIDASKFDHGISKSEVIGFLELARAKVDPGDDLFDLITEEIDCISNLKVEYDGEKHPYENGLLSGWRITSLLGSLHSASACEWIRMKTQGQFDYVVQGDDIIMFGHFALNTDLVLSACDEFGLETNASKTRSGLFGEFLKYRYSSTEISGYPARSFRAIFYANPWLDTNIDTKPQEVAQKWHTLISRFMVSSNRCLDEEGIAMYRGHAASDIKSWCGNTVKISDVFEAMDTPISVGGLGPMEMCSTDPSEVKKSLTRLEMSYPDTKTKLYSLFMNLKGIVKVEKRYISHRQRLDIIKSTHTVYRSPIYDTRHGNPRYDPNVNIFRSIIETISKGRSISRINVMKNNLNGHYIDCSVFYPRYLKKTNNWYDRLKMLTSTDDTGSPYSLLAGFRYCSFRTRYIKLMTNRFMSNLRIIVPGTKWIMAGFAINCFKKTTSLLNSL